MEKLLHYAWRHKIFPLTALRTTTGEEVEVVDVGTANTNAGPDFFNAKIKIGGTMWAGNVELHTLASDWFRHGHEHDAAYNSTILHVVTTADCPVTTAEGKTVPQMVLEIPASLRENYAQLLHADTEPRCAEVVRHIDPFTAHSWMSALVCERLEERTEQVMARLNALHGDWESTLFLTLARNFGFGLNGDAFEQWARQVPLSAAAKHRDNAFQVEALFLGTAGLLSLDAVPRGNREAAEKDEYFLRLQREYAYLAHKFSLAAPLPAERWKYLRLRPQNFPHLRLVQLAWMYQHETATWSRLLDAARTGIDALLEALQSRVSEYWETHYLFGCPGPKNEKHLSRRSRELLIINTLVPMLYAYGRHHADEGCCRRAIELLEALKPEDNYIIRSWAACGLTVGSAADSQALIQLRKRYCERRDCLRCRFGFEYLRGKRG